MDNQLAYIDQGSFLGLRALGRGPHQQYVWVYDHDMDLDALGQFHHNLGYTLFGRRIERSLFRSGGIVGSLRPTKLISTSLRLRGRAANCGNGCSNNR